MTHWTTIWLLAEEVAEAREGGLFDFDLTLPLMAAQFLLLILLLNAVFYKPLTKALDERAEYIRQNLAEAREARAKSSSQSENLEQQLREARRDAQEAIAAAQAEAQQTVSENVAAAQQEVVAQREQAAQETAEQKQAALSTLEDQVSELSGQILDKLLGSELARR